MLVACCGVLNRSLPKKFTSQVFLLFVALDKRKRENRKPAQTRMAGDAEAEVVDGADGTVFVFRRGCWVQAKRDSQGNLCRIAGDCFVLQQLQEDFQEPLTCAHARAVLHLLEAGTDWRVRVQALVFLAACDLRGLEDLELKQISHAAQQLPEDVLPWSHVRRRLVQKLSQELAQERLFVAERSLLQGPDQRAQQQRGDTVGLVDV